MPHKPTNRAKRIRRPEAKRLSPSKRGYDTAWQKLRLMYLRRNPHCVECWAQGRAVPATEVDHVVSIRKGGARLDTSNLQALCHVCHSRKTAAKDGAFGRE